MGRHLRWRRARLPDLPPLCHWASGDYAPAPAETVLEIPIGGDQGARRTTLGALIISHVGWVFFWDSRKHQESGLWPASLDSRFLTLLSLVAQGLGAHATWKLDQLISLRHAPRDDVTVQEELMELERRGLVSRREGPSGYVWTVTDAGADELALPG